MLENAPWGPATCVRGQRTFCCITEGPGPGSLDHASPMSRRLLPIALALPAFAGCILNVHTIFGNGVADSEEREVDEFDRVDVSEAVHLEIDIDPDATGTVTLSVEGDSNLIEHVETEVRDGTLFVSTNTNVHPDLDLVVRAAVPSLVGAQVVDAASLEGRGIDVDTFELDVADASTVDLDGRASALEVSVTDAASGKLLGFEVGDAHVRLRSAAHLDLCATGNVTGSVSDASSLDIYCNPADVDVEVSDASEVDIHD